MSRQSYAKALDAVLAPAGFVRDGNDWERTRDGFWDWVGLQRNQYLGVTANLATTDLVSEGILREAVPEGSASLVYQETLRIGYLMGERLDRWWLRDPNGPAELAEAIRAYGLPYFESLRSLEDQAAEMGRFSTKRHGGRSGLYLAITLYRMGEIDEARQVLSGSPKSTPPSWVVQIEGLRRRLGFEPQI